ncbi:hypothetical protein U1Q18_039776 [Sarracenia purpurea var. burkii]
MLKVKRRDAFYIDAYMQHFRTYPMRNLRRAIVVTEPSRTPAPTKAKHFTRSSISLLCCLWRSGGSSAISRVSTTRAWSTLKFRS